MAEESSLGRGSLGATGLASVVTGCRRSHSNRTAFAPSALLGWSRRGRVRSAGAVCTDWILRELRTCSTIGDMNDAERAKPAAVRDWPTWPQGWSMTGLALWVVTLGLLLALEALALALDSPDWPSLSDIFRAVTRPTLGRWLLFAAWLWLGWHLFIRGWTFFLGGPGARQPKRPTSTGTDLTTAAIGRLLISFIGLYVGLIWLTVLGRRERARFSKRTPGPLPTVARLLRYLATTATFGYLTFIAGIAGYGLVAHKLADRIIGSALRYGAFLAFAIAGPAFLFAGVLEFAWRSRVGKSADHEEPEKAPNREV